jgi:hypothetical protein
MTGLDDVEGPISLGVSGPIFLESVIDPILSTNRFRLPFHLCDTVAKTSRRELGFEPLSLRRYCPDQVQRVDGSRKPSSQPGPIPAPLSNLQRLPTIFNVCPLDSRQAVSLKKYLGHCGQLGSCGLGLKSNSSSIPILRDSSLDVRIMLGNLTSSGISTIPTA